MVTERVLMVNRRQCLGLLAGCFVVRPATALLRPRTHLSRLVSCRDDGNGIHYLTLMDPATGRQSDIRLPSRGHGMAVHPDNRQVAVFARRPGDYLWVVDVVSSRVIYRITAPEGRHYYGHGVYSQRGMYLYASENHIDGGQGIIGIYDVSAGYQRIGEINSHGIGPHELCLLSDDNTLVVANGGVQTHPDTGRAKLNIPTMQPNLAYIDVHADKLYEYYQPPTDWHQLSIRHLSVNTHNQVGIAMQYEGPRSKHPPLVGLHQGEERLRLLSAPEMITPRMKNYCGSVRFSESGNYFAVTSPRGGIVTFWSATGEYLDHIQIEDGCGVSASSGNGFYISSGNGTLIEYEPISKQRTTLTAKNNNIHWDNHLTFI
jgi:hypothetical protein